MAGTNKRKLRRRLSYARKRIVSDGLKIERARKRRDYWIKVFIATRDRLGDIKAGQIEFDV